MYSYKRAGRTLEQRMIDEIVERLEGLQRQAEYAGADGKAAWHDLSTSLALVKNTRKWFDGRGDRLIATANQVAHEILRTLKASPGRSQEHAEVYYPVVEILYKADGLPKYPPDDDGPGDAAYWQQVDAEVKFAESLVAKEKQTTFQNNIVRYEARHLEKGFIQIKITLEG
jgi:hypothetical protein